MVIRMFEIRNKTLYNDGKIVLAQVGSAFFKLRLERELGDISELSGILDNNNVYLFKKGE